MKTSTLAQALGWISIGLGVTELVAPGWLRKQLGTGNYDRLVNVFGVREIGLVPENWSRSASEAIDLVSLATAAQQRMRDGGAGTALLVLGALTALDALLLAAPGEERKKLTRKPARGARRPAAADKAPADKASADKSPRRRTTH